MTASTPTAIRFDPHGEMWVCTQGGKLYRGVELYLDIGHLITPLSAGYDERGLLGIAFHPQRPETYYLYYTAPPQGEGISIGTIEEYYGTHAVRKLLEVRRPFANHNSIDSLFFRSHDNTLLWANGDGGSSNDPLHLAQDDNSVLGKILALAVDQLPSQGMGPITRVSELPAGITVEGKGLRNPVGLDISTIAADRETFFLPMTGQDAYDYAYSFRGSGNNFGWPRYEGPSWNPAGSGSEFPHCQPFVSYSHAAGGVVITAGRVVGQQFYFTDWKNGLCVCEPSLDDLDLAVPFTRVLETPQLSTYTALGSDGQGLWIGGLNEAGDGMVLRVI